MTWIAPDVVRAEEPFIADERTMLEGWLDFHRTTLLMKCAGLTGEQRPPVLSRRPGCPCSA